VAALSLWHFDLFLRKNESHSQVLHEQLCEELQSKNGNEAEASTFPGYIVSGMPSNESIARSWH
jgi:hypothetical protein